MQWLTIKRHDYEQAGQHPKRFSNKACVFRQEMASLSSSQLHSTPNFKPTTIRPEACSLNWVSELIVEGGRRWNNNLIQFTFNKPDADAIVQIPISQLGSKDKPVWHHTRNGRFLVDSAYNWLANQDTQASTLPESSTSKARVQAIWKRSWKMKIKGKIKQF